MVPITAVSRTITPDTAHGERVCALTFRPTRATARLHRDLPCGKTRLGLGHRTGDSAARRNCGQLNRARRRHTPATVQGQPQLTHPGSCWTSQRVTSSLELVASLSQAPIRCSTQDASTHTARTHGFGRVGIKMLIAPAGAPRQHSTHTRLRRCGCGANAGDGVR